MCPDIGRFILSSEILLYRWHV